MELQIHSMLWIEKSLKSSQPRTHCIDEETKTKQRIQEKSENTVVHCIDHVKE